MYQAIVSSVTVRKHPNADRLQIGSVRGATVIVGIDVKDGELGLFFTSDGQLSEQFATANNLVRIKNEDGTYSGGMFDANRRVRAMNLRGVKSEGFWCPVDYLRNVPGIKAATVDNLKDGDTFDTLDGVPICNKYYTPQTLQAIANRNNSSPAKKVLNFPEHVDTEQYRYVKNDIPLGSVIVITEKLHGTSGRYGLVEVDRNLTWLERLLQKVGIKVQDKEYKYFNGTRRTVLKDVDSGTSFYGDETFRRDAVKGINLKPGEMLYFELVGYTTNGNLIMSAQDTIKLDKNMVKVYGKEMQYTYGCTVGECRMFVYRITQHGVELNHWQMTKRCAELGLNVVPHLTALVLDNREQLDTLVEAFMYGSSTLDGSHIREGVVLRVDNDFGTKFIKSKSVNFGILEGYIKDNDAAVDMEEVS